jgi:hypothetical protein
MEVRKLENGDLRIGPNAIGFREKAGRGAPGARTARRPRFPSRASCRLGSRPRFLDLFSKGARVWHATTKWWIAKEPHPSAANPIARSSDWIQSTPG